MAQIIGWANVRGDGFLLGAEGVAKVERLTVGDYKVYFNFPVTQGFPLVSNAEIGSCATLSASSEPGIADDYVHVQAGFIAVGEVGGNVGEAFKLCDNQFCLVVVQ